MPYDVSVIGLGRVGLPLALAFADAGLRVLGIDKDADRLEAVRSRRMPFKEPGTDELLARVGAGRVGARDRRRRRRTRSCSRSARRRSRTSRSTWATSARCSTTCCRCCAPGQLLVLRSTVAPGTTEFVAGYLEKQRGFTVGEDLFVAHVPERIAADRFLEEIGTLPCIVGGVGEGSGERAARLFEVLGAPIVQTTPVQAELAKIWTNILRYTTFALPNLLMMDCERYGANVFDVIDLINRDYPARRHGGAGPDGRDLPAQGLRVLGGEVERARDAARRLARARERAAVPGRRRQAPARRLAARAQGRRARAGVQARHRRRARLAVAQAPAAARARAGRRRRARPDGRDADGVVRAGRRRRRRRRRRHQPQRVRAARGAAAIGERAKPDCLVVDPWNTLGAAQVFAYANEIAALRT